MTELRAGFGAKEESEKVGVQSVSNWHKKLLTLRGGAPFGRFRVVQRVLEKTLTLWLGKSGDPTRMYGKEACRGWGEKKFSTKEDPDDVRKSLSWTTLFPERSV